MDANSITVWYFYLTIAAPLLLIPFMGDQS